MEGAGMGSNQPYERRVRAERQAAGDFSRNDDSSQHYGTYGGRIGPKTSAEEYRDYGSDSPAAYVSSEKHVRGPDDSDEERDHVASRGGHFDDRAHSFNLEAFGPLGRNDRGGDEQRYRHSDEGSTRSADADNFKWMMEDNMGSDDFFALNLKRSENQDDSDDDGEVCAAGGAGQNYISGGLRGFRTNGGHQAMLDRTGYGLEQIQQFGHRERDSSGMNFRQHSNREVTTSQANRHLTRITTICAELEELRITGKDLRNLPIFDSDRESLTSSARGTRHRACASLERYTMQHLEIFLKIWGTALEDIGLDLSLAYLNISAECINTIICAIQTVRGLSTFPLMIFFIKHDYVFCET